MHTYGKWPDKYFNQLEEAGEFIGGWLRKWARMEVTQTKEKFGTLRVYCNFGWSSMYSLLRPGYMWIPKWWPHKLDWLMTSLFLRLLIIIAIPIQKSLYRYRYKKAVEKWPHLRDEILSCADWGELFEGYIPGYKHSDYWKVMK